jgi:hypothetical protein
MAAQMSAVLKQRRAERRLPAPEDPGRRAASVREIRGTFWRNTNPFGRKINKTARPNGFSDSRIPSAFAAWRRLHGGRLGSVVGGHTFANILTGVITQVRKLVTGFPPSFQLSLSLRSCYAEYQNQP